MPVPSYFQSRAGFLRAHRTALALSVLALVLIVTTWVRGNMLASHLTTFAHQSLFVLGPILGWLALAGLAALAFWFTATPAKPELRHSYNWADRERYEAEYQQDLAQYERDLALSQKVGGAAKAIGVALVLATLAAVGFTIKFWVTHSYTTDRQYLSAIRVVTDPAPSFAQRAAAPIAAASARTNLAGTTGDLEDVRYIANGATGTWNALVDRKATFGGYQAVEEQHIGLTGTTESTTICAFDTTRADRRLGGRFSHSLDRAIFTLARGTTFDAGDAYGLCTGARHDHPVVVVPLKKVVGWWYAHEVPAGVALYDGITGQVTVKTHVTAGEIPGPVYPVSLAVKTREAAAATGSFSDYWHNRSGFEDTSGDENDPNGENPSEFSLRTLSDRASYVTPLTPRGGSASIVAEAVMDSDSLTAGVYNTLVVHKLPQPRIANSTAAQRIRGDYGDLPEWAAHMEIFEITPVTSTEWVASLGQNQDVNYRVRFKADGSSCLERADGTKLRCGKVTGTGSFGPGVALQAAGATPAGNAPVAVPANSAALHKLTDAQLAQLQEQVTRELLSRIHAPASTK